MSKFQVCLQTSLRLSLGRRLDMQPFSTSLCAQAKLDLVAHIPRLRAFAISFCGSADRADDLVQETLVKAWNHQASFVEGTNLKAWLFTILRNVYFSQYRKRKHEVPDIDGFYSSTLAVAPGQTSHMEMLELRVASHALARQSARGFALGRGRTLIRRGGGNLWLRDRHCQEPRQPGAEVVGRNAV